MKVIYDEFGNMGEFPLSDESHKYPEWKKFQTRLESGYSSRFPMNYEDFFEAPSEDEENPIFTFDSEYLNLSKELFLENGYIYQLV